jgi:hypothetical protein
MPRPSKPTDGAWTSSAICPLSWVFADPGFAGDGGLDAKDARIGEEKVVGGSLDCLPGLRGGTMVLRSGGRGWWIIGLEGEMVEMHRFRRWRVGVMVGFIVGR